MARFLSDRFVDESSPEATKLSRQGLGAWETWLQTRAGFLQLVVGLDL
jgi:hypothetical protein